MALYGFSPYWFLLSLWLSSAIAIVCYSVTKDPIMKHSLLIIIATIWFLSGLRDRDAWMNVFFVFGIVLSDQFFFQVKKINIHQASVLLLLNIVAFALLNHDINRDSIRYCTGYKAFLTISTLKFFLRASIGIAIATSVSIVIKHLTTVFPNGIKLCCMLGKMTLPIYLTQKVFIEYGGRFVVFLLGSNYPEIMTSNPIIYSIISTALSLLLTTILIPVCKWINSKPIPKKLLLGN